MTTPTDIVRTIVATAMQGAATALATRLNGTVDVRLGSDVPVSNALFRFTVPFGADGSMHWYVSNEDATAISDLLIGGDGSREATLTEMHLDALSGAFSDLLEQCVGGISTLLTSPLVADGPDLAMESGVPSAPDGGERLVLILGFSSLGDVTVVVDLTAELARRVARDGAAVAASAQLAGGGSSAPAPEASAPQAAEPAPAPDNDGTVVALPNIADVRERTQSQRGDLSMLLNVPLEISVQLGSTQRTVRDVLELTAGSILELDKLAGDPMDILVNGTILARGEVVVIDEEFGVRITEILSPEQRLRHIS